MKITDLYLNLTEEKKLRDQYSVFKVRKIEIGMLNLPSGKVVACDPFMIANNDPAFDQEVPSGEYPVSIIIAKNLENEDERIAAAIIEFSSLIPDKWMMATKEDQKLSELPEGHVFGYGVDSGTGTFIDFDTAKILVKNFMENDSYFNKLIEPFNENYIHTRSWMIYTVDQARNLNAAIFSSGYGDGFYPSYWGCAADNSIVCLLTDFDILGDAEYVDE